MLNTINSGRDVTIILRSKLLNEIAAAGMILQSQEKFQDNINKY